VPAFPHGPAHSALCAIAVAFFGLVASPALAAKTDVLVLRNGDRITGEVDVLERGKLQFKTDDVGTIEVEWDKVVSVSAKALFDVDDLDGGRYVGALEPGPVPGQLSVASGGRSVLLTVSEIASIRRIGATFWQRLDGSVDAGASYTSASEIFTLDVAAAVRTEHPGYEVAAEGASTLTTQPEEEDTRRSEVGVAYRRRFPRRWLALSGARLEQNRELGFDLRSSATVGAGRYLVRQQRQRLLTGLGVSLNREEPVEGEGSTNVELTAVLSYDVVSYDSPKVDVSIGAMGFASLTDSGRWRFEADFNLKRELVKDFYVTLRGYESYDSRPATADAASNDYGITFALGWSF
jgi:hypothetical protein